MQINTPRRYFNKIAMMVATVSGAPRLLAQTPAPGNRQPPLVVIRLAEMTGSMKESTTSRESVRIVAIRERITSS